MTTLSKSTERALKQYLYDIPTLYNEAAKTHRFAALIGELFPGTSAVSVGFCSITAQPPIRCVTRGVVYGADLTSAEFADVTSSVKCCKTFAQVVRRESAIYVR